MIPFLKSIAKAYTSRYADLSEMCFVFPNKRSGTFFLKYLKEECGRAPILSPQVATITDFVGDLSGMVVASRLDQLFLLYGSYREMRGLATTGAAETWADDFESFRVWGETVLSDFSEVDQYMVDYREVFKNVKDFREITSNFLTDEQKRVMMDYFGHTDFGDPGQFWKTFEEDGKKDEKGDGNGLSKIKDRFLRLWQILSPLYETFKGKLDSLGLATSGGTYRRAVEVLREKGRESLPYKKVVAVGFNALSTSESALFAELAAIEGCEGLDSYADFFWDATGPVLSTGVNSASRFVRSNISRFPSPEWARRFLRESDSRVMPRLRVVGSPSKSAQVKIAGRLLAEQRERLSANEITDAKVAAVLPDEGLLLPMLYSLPKGMGNVNLTMGYSLRLTSVVPFVTLLRRLLGGIRISGGAPAYYHKDLRLFLAHPFSGALFGRESIMKILGFLDRHHRSSITLEELASFSPKAAEMLDPLRQGVTPLTTIAYADEVLGEVSLALAGGEETAVNRRLEVDHITVYRNALRRLGDLLAEYAPSMKPATVFRLVDRLLAGEKVGFEGEPLTGLQVMGTLETRSVDFDYITILSMNERIMPRRARSRSFIPDSLRHAYGMPPSNYAESIFAYYFFRMISRAKEVTMIYDARTGGGSGGSGVSRYILQLSHLYAKGNIERQDWKFRLAGREGADSSVRKSPEVAELLRPFREEGGRNFSATSLTTYRECEVKFFYRHVMGIDVEEAPSEYIDAIMVGNILHDVMLNVYLPEKYQRRFLSSPVVVGRDRIEELLSQPDFLWLLVTRAVNRLHFRLRGEEETKPLEGGAEMVGRQILQQVRRVLAHDLTIAPFKIIGCEIEKTLRIPLRDGAAVNFKFAIDRLDSVMLPDGIEKLRIVDYKTGKLEQDAPDEESLLTGDHTSKQLFQLFTYAWLLGKSGSKYATDDVRVEIYHVPGFGKGGVIPLPKIGDATVDSYSDYSAMFSEGIERMLGDVFAKGQFDAATEEGRCDRCELRMLCGK